MPVWVTFRDAARAARHAEFAAEAQANLAPQPERFRGAPLAVFGRHDEGALAQMRTCMAVGYVARGMVCADGHIGYAQPVGGVVADEGQVSASGIGFDIACGTMAVRLDTPYPAVKDRAAELLAVIRRHVSFGVGRANAGRGAHPALEDEEAWRASGMEDYRQKAAAQLGTVGSGNHYVDLFEDEAGLVWIGVHFGSRGLGHSSATRHLKLAGGQHGMNVPPTVLDEAPELGARCLGARCLGARCLGAMELAGRYAYAGREWVVERARGIIGGAVTDSVHNNHNFAWREQHGERYAGLPEPARLRRRLDGRRRGDPGGGGQRGLARRALLHRPRRRPRARPEGGAAPASPRRDGGVAARPGRAALGRRPRRIADGLPPAGRRAGGARGDSADSAPAAAFCGRDGGAGRV